MQFPKTPMLLLPAMTLAFTLPARAYQKNVAASLPRHLDVPWPSWPCPSSGRTPIHRGKLPVAPFPADLNVSATATP
jgi:hypothetical protein